MIGDYPICRGNPEDHRGGGGSMRHGNAARIPAVVFFKNRQGQIYLPGRNDARLPPGYERHETTQPSEVRGLIKQMDTESRIQREQATFREEVTLGEERRQRRSDLFQRMGTMSNRGKDFARYAIERNNAKAKPEYRPGNHMIALEYNDSNHDAAIPKERPHATESKEVLGGVGGGPAS